MAIDNRSATTTVAYLAPRKRAAGRGAPMVNGDDANALPADRMAVVHTVNQDAVNRTAANGHAIGEAALLHAPPARPTPTDSHAFDIYRATLALQSVDDRLPSNDFLKELHREERRAERSGCALSLVLYQFADAADPSPPRNALGLPSAQSAAVDHLLDAIYSSKRETDIVGHVGSRTIALLCPDTGEAGRQCLQQKINQRAGPLPCQVAAAIYPDDLFASLRAGTAMPQAFAPFLIGTDAAHTTEGYPLKRTLDVVGATAALVLLALPMVLVAAAIALTSPGAPLFKQTRIGKRGVPFTFYKFRSMASRNDDRIHREFVAGLINGVPPAPAANGQPVSYKLKSDPRVTRLGRFLRKTSIDELPQFFNVLKGDMSLVGPRPPVPYESVHYQPWHLRRILSIKPGITGLWQVEGRSTVSFNEMVRMDLRYLRDCSLALDLKLLLKTVRVVLRCNGAT